MSVQQYMNQIDGQRAQAHYYLDRMPIITQEDDRAALDELQRLMPGCTRLRLEVFLRDYREAR